MTTTHQELRKAILGIADDDPEYARKVEKAIQDFRVKEEGWKLYRSRNTILIREADPNEAFRYLAKLDVTDDDPFYIDADEVQNDWELIEG